MLLDSHSASLTPPPSAPPRRWYPCAGAQLPPEPGRLATNVIVNVARHARGCTTRGDDRIETRANALRRLLWRWGHAKRSGCYATSIWQLVDGLAPILGWGSPPPKGHPDRERFCRAHAQNVRRWLEDLQAGGLISFAGEPDNRGQDWRTIITLHQTPELPADELEAATRRKNAWERRRRVAARARRKRRRPPRGQRLELIVRGAQRPQRDTRRRLAIARARAIRDRRAAAATPGNESSPVSEDRTHHFVAPPTSESLLEGKNVITEHHVCFDSSGVTRARANQLEHAVAAFKSPPQTASLTEPRVFGSPNGDVTSTPALQTVAEYAAAIAERVAAVEAARRSRVELIANHAARRADELAASAANRRWPSWRVQEAWVVWRHSALLIGEHGRGPGLAGPLEPDDLALLARAAERYERSAARRPRGWPAGGYAALEHTARLARERDERPLILHYAIIAIDQLSRRMHAITVADDPKRLAAMIARARRRRQPSAPTRLQFRTGRPQSPWPHWVALDEHGAPILTDQGLELLDVPGTPDRTDERYRDTLRDAYLVAGMWPPPEADGVTALALNGATAAALADERRAQPGPYAPPDGADEIADTADVELASLTGMQLRATQRLDLDERDRRLHNARREQAERAREDQQALRSRLADRRLADPDNT
jgi:hypothetical protein